MLVAAGLLLAAYLLVSWVRRVEIFPLEGRVAHRRGFRPLVNWRSQPLVIAWRVYLRGWPEANFLRQNELLLLGLPAGIAAG